MVVIKFICYYESTFPFILVNNELKKIKTN